VKTISIFPLATYLSGSIASINRVTWVMNLISAGLGDRFRGGNQSRNVTTHSGQFSQATSPCENASNAGSDRTTVIGNKQRVPCCSSQQCWHCGSAG